MVIKKYLLILIILVGVILRLYRFGDFMAFYGDSGRDILIAKHMIEYDGFTFIRPYAYGGSGSIENTPVYYWLLAGFWFFARSGIGVGVIVALLSSFTIYLGYLIGKELHDDKTGLLAASFISVSSLFVTYSRSVWQPYIIPVFVAFGLLCLMKLERTKQMRYMVGLLVSSFIALNIHLSFIPVFIIWMVIAVDQFIEVKSKRTVRIGIVVLCILGSLQWIVMTDLVKLLQTVVKNHSATLSIIEFSQFQYIFLRISQSVSELLGYPSQLIVIIYMICMVAGLASALLKEKSSSRNLSMAIATLGSICFLGFYRNPNGGVLLEPRYYAPYFLVYTIVLAYVITRLYTVRALYFALIIVTIFILGKGNLKYLGAGAFDSFVVMKSISTAIYADEQKNQINVADVQILNKHLETWEYDWSTGPYWYFMEKLYNTKLIQITDRGSNMQMITQPKFIYLVCVLQSRESLDTVCLQPFLDTYKNMDSVSNTPIYTYQSRFIYDVHRFAQKQ